MIQNINIEKLYPHPDNPRKALGDLSELSDSIKRSGVMQNLTAVKNGEDSYTVIIGHRRLAATRLAGLTEVPVVIVEMTEKEQLATMLLENMQRSDLTVLEQAEGIQLMLDVGESIESVSEMTGFSQSTIRHRTKLLELDRDKLSESLDRGATISDYIKLEQIKDEKLKNDALSKIGTDNFEHALRTAKQNEENKANMLHTLAQLDTFAVCISEENLKEKHYVHAAYYSKKNKNTVDIPDDTNQQTYYYTVGGYYFTLYRELTEQELKEKAAAETERKNQGIEDEKLLDTLKAEAETAYELRKAFIEGLPNQKIKAHIADIIKTMLLVATIEGFEISYYNYNEKSTIECIGLPKYVDGDIAGHQSAVAGIIKKSSEKYLLLAVYHAADNKDSSYMRSRWHRAHCANEVLDIIYELLVKLGYKISDIEKSLQNGTHPAFLASEETIE